MNYPAISRRLALGSIVCALLIAAPFAAHGLVAPKGERPPELDVRGFDGALRGTALRQPTTAQTKALASLQNSVSGPLVTQYNGLTATPRHVFSHSGYLSAPSSAPAETIAREFISQWRAIWRFSESDLENLRLKSRATLPDTGTTVLLFEQQVDGISVYKGEVLVNVSHAGEVISVGNANFPELTVTNSFAISPAQAVSAAAASLGVTGFAPTASGGKEVLRTFGDLPKEFEQGQRFSGGDAFTDEIVVTRVIFPLGEEGRAAYQFTLSSAQHESTMWEHIVDASTGAVLRRLSLTAFQQGGGPQNSRRGSFRPDVQTLVESFASGSGAGKVFDGGPTGMSGPAGLGRPTRAQLPQQPGYTDDTQTAFPARAFRRGLVFGRAQLPFANAATPLFGAVNNTPFGQSLRGFPNAVNPSPESPFGWFYLPTDSNGAEITISNSNRGATRDHGYTMHAAAKTRNQVNPGNSPGGDGDQPFSADLTDIPDITIPDGRMMTAVFQSRYTEGNNVLVADDKDNDNETTHGIKGFALGRQFTAPYFDFASRYEIDNEANPDVFPGTLTLFYYNNLLHDYLYSIGFTEALWNFQLDNFGKGGAGNDGVSVQVQDGSGTNNANFSTGNDGSRPRMQMYLFTDGSFRRADGDFDFDVVAHELYHGVSNRSVGKGSAGCLGNPLVGESGGMGEGWSDFIANSMADDDAVGEYATGEWDIAIRRLPGTNFRYSYRTITGAISRRDRLPPDASERTYVAFETHDVGEMWAATLWDMRELLIVKQDIDDGPAVNYPGVFFDGVRRMGSGTTFYIGHRPVQSVDTQHPISYRATFNTGNPATIVPSQHVVRPGMVAAEIQSEGDRNGPLATAVARGARLADRIVLRGMQLAPCNPSFVDMRDSMLMADSELTAGENRAIIWRAFASHGVGVGAASTSSGDPGSQAAPIIVEDFAVPPGVTQCEEVGPLPPPAFTLSNLQNNVVEVTITPATGAATYVIARANNPNGPFIRVAEIPATETTYTDNNGGEGLVLGQTYHYQVRAKRNADCVSLPSTSSITITMGVALQPAPSFAGLAQAGDPQAGDRIVLNWTQATSVEPTAVLVYDIYRVAHVEHGTGQNDPTFTPSAANRIAMGVTGTSFVDTGLTLNQVYYYIVQARDPASGKIDTGNLGNRIARWNAPTIPCFTGAPFALETFEAASANSRFAPPLVDSGNMPNQAVAAFQRVTGVNLGSGITSATMYGPSFDPPNKDGGPSDFPAVIGPLTLTPTSIMEFDHLFSSEATFDGGVIEIAIGAPNFNATPFADNATTFDLGDYMIEGGYNLKLNGTSLGSPLPLSHLQGRRAFTGFKGLHHTRISLRSFAPGGVHNPGGAQVYIRFRMTSDAGTSVGTGWNIDNLVVRNMGASGQVAPPQVVSRKTHSSAGTFDIPLPLTGPRGIECRSGGANGDYSLVFNFGVPLTSVNQVTVSGNGSVSSSGPGQDGREFFVNLTGVSNGQVLTVSLNGVTDACGNNAASISVPMGVLLGDTTANGAVNSSDIGQAKDQSGQPITAANFRTDVTVNGAINGSDISLIKANSGTSLPSGARPAEVDAQIAPEESAR